MGRRCCCILNCPSRRDKKSQLSMFTPPVKKPLLLEKWSRALKGHISPSAGPLTIRNFICELHFKPEQLDRMFVTKLPDGSTWAEKKHTVRLFPNSVPCVFNVKPKVPTYIFDIKEDSDDSESVEEDCEQTDRQLEEDENAKTEEDEELEVKTEDDITNSDVHSEAVVIDEREEISRKGNGEKIKIVFSAIVSDVSDGDSNAEASGGEEPEVVFCARPESQASRDELDNSDGRTNESGLVDVRKILGPPRTDKSVINDINAFTRLCRKYIATELDKKGRPSQLDLYGLDPPSPGSAKNVYVYPTAMLDVETLVSHIDHVEYPSENWFCTMKNGSPTFLCWKENSIHKIVIFEMQMRNMNAIVYLGKVLTHFSEIAKPKSIHEVNSILKLVDCAEKCPEENPSVCNGYFFPATSGGVSLCEPCKIASRAKPLEARSLTFRLAVDSAQEVVSDLPNWSFTVWGTSLVFIGWKKQYVPEKLYILTSHLRAEVIFGGDNGSFDDICSPRSIEDIRLALRFLDGCVKCVGVDELHRSDRCPGFVFPQKRKLRNKTCKACSDLKKKLIRAVPGHSSVEYSVAKHKALWSRASKKLVAKNASTWLNEEESSSDHMETDEEHTFLLDALDSIMLPSNRWTYAVVEDTVIFQYWKDNLTLLKKVVVNLDLSVQITVLDRNVELEDVDAVSSVDDVVRILNTVDCIRVCEGYDEFYRKDKDCTGYNYQPVDGDPCKEEPYRCPKCALVHAFRSRKDSPVKNRMIFERVEREDFEEPSSKKVALEITLSPCSTSPRGPGTPMDEER